MRLTKAVAPIMKAQGRGRIVNIASVAGLSPTGSSIAYSYCVIIFDACSDWRLA